MFKTVYIVTQRPSVEIFSVLAKCFYQLHCLSFKIAILRKAKKKMAFSLTVFMVCDIEYSIFAFIIYDINWFFGFIDRINYIQN